MLFVQKLTTQWYFAVSINTIVFFVLIQHLRSQHTVVSLCYLLKYLATFGPTTANSLVFCEDDEKENKCTDNAGGDTEAVKAEVKSR